jgi:hypothetical protein
VAKPDPIIEALGTLVKDRGGAKMLLPTVCTPEQLAAIKAARIERGASYRQIASALKAGGIVVSESTVKNWLQGQGIA